MAGSVNKIILLGRIGKDPEIRSTATGVTVATASIATSEKFKGNDGQYKEKTEWHRLVFWGKLGEIAGKYLVKGAQTYIEGKLTHREYEDKTQTKKHITEIVVTNLILCGHKSEPVGSQPQYLDPTNPGINMANNDGAADDDSVPF